MTLSDNQHSYNGFVIGAGTDFEIMSVDGLEGFITRSASTELPRGHGGVPGKHYTGMRLFATTVEVVGDPETVEGLIAELHAAVVPSEDDLFEYRFKHPGRPERLVWCRPLTAPRVLNSDTQYVSPEALTFEAPDPRIYSAEATTTVIPLYSPSGGGIEFPFNFPLNFAAGAQVEAVVTNEGTADAYPTIRFYGPASEVSMTNITTGQQVVFETTILAGQVLTFDPGPPVASVTLDGSNRYSSWQQVSGVGRLPLALPPGDSVLRFEADDAAQAVVTHRSTWLS